MSKDFHNGFPHKSRVGLLFDGSNVIAEFRSFTSEDCHGGRIFFGLSLSEEDIERFRDTMFPSEELTKPTPLRAVYVEYNLKAGENSPGKLIEDFGFQYISSFVVEEKQGGNGFTAQLWVVKMPQAETS